MVEGRDAGTSGGHSLKSAGTEECFCLLHVFSLAVAALVVLYALEHAVGTANTEKTLDMFPFLRNKERNTLVHVQTLHTFPFRGNKAKNIRVHAGDWTCFHSLERKKRARNTLVQQGDLE